MKKFKIITKWILLVVLFFTIAGAAAAAVYIGTQVREAPDISSIDATPDGYLTTVLDKNGNKIDSLYETESNRVYVRLEDIPENLQNGFIAIEDSRFYKHHGIDIKGITRALFKGIAERNFSQGASTITQQLLKNNVFTDWMSENTFKDRLNRKIREWYLAIQLEKEYSKEWILENYLNTINLGGGTRGVQVASQYYFGKDVSELDLAESALIAGITKNPSGFDPYKHPEESIARQRLVLEAMYSQKLITEDAYNAALNEDVLGSLIQDHSQNTRVLSWFEDALLTAVVSDLEDKCGYSEEAAWDLIYTGGLTICSTQDSAVQEICEEAVNKGEFIQDGEQVSVVVNDVNTGAVAAIIGGRGNKDASLVYDRAIESVRQPGSTIKVIGEYAAALDKNSVTLGTAIDDEPYSYSNGTEIHNANGQYGGMTTVRSALTDSCNVVALKLFQEVGQDTVVDYLDSFGITTLDANDYNEALAIGGTYNGVTNLEMTAAYNAIASKGNYVKPYFYTKVTDRDGKAILYNEAQGHQVISEEAADMLTLALEDVMTSGTGSIAKVDSTVTAGKSGTTNDCKDVWFIGFSPYYTCGVWGGYDDCSAQVGGDYVKLLWADIMESVHNDIEGASEAELVDTSKYIEAVICSKCGKLAIEGMCSNTVQGDMTVTEYFTEDTLPTEKCDCHKIVTICKESGLKSNFYCPSYLKEQRVYLKHATDGTLDEGYGADTVESESCTVHKRIWNKFEKDESEEEDSGTTGGSGGADDGWSSEDDESEDSGSEHPIRDWFNNWFEW